MIFSQATTFLTLLQSHYIDMPGYHSSSIVAVIFYKCASCQVGVRKMLPTGYHKSIIVSITFYIDEEKIVIDIHAFYTYVFCQVGVSRMLLLGSLKPSIVSSS